MSPKKTTRKGQRIKAVIAAKKIEQERAKFQFLPAVFLGGVAVILAIAAGLWIAKREESNVANLLPAQQTVTLLELPAAPLTSPKELSGLALNRSWFNSMLSPAFITALQKIDQPGVLEGGGSLVFLESDEHPDPLLLLPIKNQRLLKRLLQGAATLKDTDLYQFSEVTAAARPVVYAVKINGYLVLTEDIFAFDLLTAVAEDPALSLFNDPNYQKALSNLPRQAAVRVYLKGGPLPLFSGEELSPLNEPIRQLLDHFFLTLQQDPAGFKFNTYLTLTPDLLVEQADPEPVTHPYRLTERIGAADLMAYVGGSDLAGDILSTLETLHRYNPPYALLLEGLMRAQVRRYFGDAIELRTDLYPLAGGDYALAFSGAENEPLSLQLLLAHQDKIFTEAKLQKFLAGFQSVAGQFVPKTEVITLPDGTQSTLLIANPDRVKALAEDYLGYAIHCLVVQDSIYGFCFTVTDELAIVSNNLERIKETIDLTLKPEFVLAQYQPFRQALGRLSKVSDQITFIKLDRLKSRLEKSDEGILWNVLLSLFDSFDSVTFVKHSFKDGVSTEGFLLLQ